MACRYDDAIKAVNDAINGLEAEKQEIMDNPDIPDARKPAMTQSLDVQLQSRRDQITMYKQMCADEEANG